MKKKVQRWFDSAILREDESKTTRNSKHFILNNGTRKAIFSPTNMNYYDESTGKWKTINNALKATENGYQTQFGKYTAKLSKNSDNETVEITNDSSTISWEIILAGKSSKRG